MGVGPKDVDPPSSALTDHRTGAGSEGGAAETQPGSPNPRTIIYLKD